MYLHKTKNGHYTPPCCYFSGELEVVECLPQTFSGGLMVTALKKDFTKEQLKETIAYQAMSRIGILYKIEEMIHNKTPEEKYEERQKQSRPVMDAMFE